MHTFNSAAFADLLLSESKKVVIVTHANPDGDSIGSSSALAMLFAAQNHKVVAITPNSSPAYLSAVEGFDFQIDFLNKTAEAVAALKGADLIICSDLHDYKKRTGEVGTHIDLNKSALKVVFDHHVVEDFDLSLFDHTFIDSDFSSACHVVLKTIIEANLTHLIDKSIASALYTGIMTDTGNFSYGRIDSELFNDVAILLDKGVKPQEIINAVLNVKNESALRIMGHALSSRMIIDYKKRAASIALTKEDLSDYGYKSGDCEGIVNIPLSIKGIDNAAFFNEADGFVKVSLRSLPEGRDMNNFARTFFNGGGHIKAAGGKSFTSLEEALKIYWQNI